jgi:hypothetical protein
MLPRTYCFYFKIGFLSKNWRFGFCPISQGRAKEMMFFFFRILSIEKERERTV